MELFDPTTGRALPPDSIQRILFVAPKVHVYNIPPLTSMRGHVAASWTTDASRHIFTARLRIIETSTDTTDTIKVDAVLEDAASGQLFAAAPYTDPAVVEPAVDSSRFFAVTVRDENNRKAVLGIGFEERSDAFDFAVALQAARKALGWEGSGSGAAAAEKKQEEAPKDYSLKEGQTITVNLGGASRRKQRDESAEEFKPESGAGGGGFALPPPPSAQDVKAKRRSLMDLGFDDGQFGEFA